MILIMRDQIVEIEDYALLRAKSTHSIRMRLTVKPVLRPMQTLRNIGLINCAVCKSFYSSFTRYRRTQLNMLFNLKFFRVTYVFEYVPGGNVTVAVMERSTKYECLPQWFCEQVT